MAYAFFQIPCGAEGGAGDELNAFLRSHLVLAVPREWESGGERSYWAFCVQYREGGPQVVGKIGGVAKIDYKEVLTDSQFTLYVKLRDPITSEVGLTLTCHSMGG